MDTIKHLIKRCHEQRKTTLKQRRTIVTPAPHNSGHPYHMKTFCAFRYPVMISDVEDADISFMPIARTTDNDNGPRDLDDIHYLKRQKAADWSMRQWVASYGLQIFTGIPSENNGAYWHDFIFTYNAIKNVPDAVMSCLEVMIDSVPNPLLTLGKDGELRFTCRIPAYLHADTENALNYVHRYLPNKDIPNKREVYLIIKGLRNSSQWDAQYEIILGDILDPPRIAKEVVFAPVDALRAELHKPDPKISDQELTLPASPFTINTGKEAKEKQEKPIETIDNPPHTLIHSELTPEMLKIRSGSLSPLALKRDTPILSKSTETDSVYKSFKLNGVEIHDILSKNNRIHGLIADTEVEKKQSETETFVRSGSALSLNVPSYALAEKLERRLQKQKAELFQR